MLVAMVGMYWRLARTDIPSLMGFPFGTDDFRSWYTDRWRHASLWLAFCVFAVKMPMWPVHMAA
jgi:NADH-quinone oxidoreductase subunit M